MAGPAATLVTAERLIAERLPDAAIIDINLRGGELAYQLIDRLCNQGVRVIVTTGYADLPLAQGKAAAIPFAKRLDGLRHRHPATKTRKSHAISGVYAIGAGWR